MTPNESLVYFITVFLASAGVCVIGSLFLRFLRWVRSIIACWRDNANDDQVLP